MCTLDAESCLQNATCFNVETRRSLAVGGEDVWHLTLVAYGPELKQQEPNVCSALAHRVQLDFNVEIYPSAGSR